VRRSAASIVTPPRSGDGRQIATFGKVCFALDQVCGSFVFYHNLI
jgi:hypothetical protein